MGVRGIGAGDVGPLAHVPAFDETICDVGIGGGELLGDDGRVGFEEEHGGVNGIGERAGENELTAVGELPGQIEMGGAKLGAAGEVVVGHFVEEEVVHGRSFPAMNAGLSS